LSHDSHLSRVPTPLSGRKATRTGTPSRVSGRPGVVGDPGMCGSSLDGNREVPRLIIGGAPSWSASGR
jgi:hypothetical protein